VINLILRNFIKLIISLVGFFIRPLVREPAKINKPERIGILLWGGIGNYVLFSPALYGIRERFPDAHLAICSFPPFASSMFFKSVDCFITINGNPSLKRLIKLLFLVKRFKPDIVLSNSMSPTFLTSFIAFLSGAKVRIGMDRGFRGFLNNIRIGERKEHEVLTNNRIAQALFVDTDEEPLAIDISENDRKIAEGAVNHFFMGREDWPLVAIQPGSGKKQLFKRWDMGKFKALTERLLQKGWKVVIVGTEEEKEEIEYIEKSIKHNRLKILKERLTLPQITHFLKYFDLIIANDTSLVHLAAISSVPSVVIYGPTNPAKNKAWGVKSRLVRKELPCSPCYNFRTPNCRYNFKCLKEIAVEDVLAAAQALLANQTK